MRPYVAEQGSRAKFPAAMRGEIFRSDEARQMEMCA
jgi:hypothetical protein